MVLTFGICGKILSSPFNLCSLFFLDFSHVKIRSTQGTRGSSVECFHEDESMIKASGTWLYQSCFLKQMGTKCKLNLAVVNILLYSKEIKDPYLLKTDQ